jgi:hypothetical protein
VGVSTRGEALSALARPALLAFWALVLWGTLLLAMAVFDAFADGPRTTFARLLPTHGASLWAWLNAAAVGLALAAWVVGVGLVVAARRSAVRGA